MQVLFYEMIGNATPHDVDIATENGVMTFHKSGCQIRVKSNVETIGQLVDALDNITIKLFKESLGEIEFVGSTQAIKNCDALIVSRVVATALIKNKALMTELGNPHILVPGELVRDDKGTIKGCKGVILMEE